MADCHQAALTEIDGLEPLARARAAGTIIESCVITQNEAAAIRRQALTELLDAGYRRSQLATELGLAAPRITQILRDTTFGAERRFFDGGPLTIAVAGKHAAERPEPVVSADSLAAWETLRSLAAQYRRAATYEVIPPPGHALQLNRPGLVVLGSPRLLPFAGQVVDCDEAHGFRAGTEGWYLVDHTVGVDYKSKVGTGQPCDYAYVGRLPRPDGKGTWLYLAGIHGPGTRGAAIWLSEHVADVWRVAKTSRFSVLIEVQLHSGTGRITDTEAVTDIRVFGDN
jgi:hypothetical protein